MSVKWEKQEGSTGTLTVTVPAEKVDAALDQAFKKVVKTLQAPGFRKGKMPRKMFEKMYGVESLYNDALDILLQDAYGPAVEEAGIDPVDRPNIDVVELEKGKDLIFTAEVTVKPEVTLGDYKGLEATRESSEVTDEEIDEQLAEKQKSFAELVVKEDEAIETGDTAIFDFAGFVDGEPFEGGNAENYELEIGSGSFIPGFEEQMVGLKAGEEKEVTVTFPEEYHAAELAGQPAMFAVKVHEVKGKEVPELNDELAKEIDETVETLDELRAKLKEETQQAKEQSAEVAYRDELVRAAAANATIDVPAIMFDNEVDRMMEEFGQRLQSQGMNLELYFQFSGQDETQLREQMQTDAEERVRISLVLEAIAAAEEVVVDQAEVDVELEKMSAQFNMDIDQIKKALGSLAMIENDLRMNKTIDLIVENAK